MPDDMVDTSKYANVEFDWIQLSQEIQPEQDGFMGKSVRKFKENPFVPIGAFSAVGALSYGLWSMVQGNQKHSQYAMRARIGFQGFAIAALIVGFLRGGGGGETPAMKRQKMIDENARYNATN